MRLPRSCIDDVDGFQRRSIRMARLSCVNSSMMFSFLYFLPSCVRSSTPVAEWRDRRLHSGALCGGNSRPDPRPGAVVRHSAGFVRSSPCTGRPDYHNLAFPGEVVLETLSDLSDATKGKPNVKIRRYSHSIKSRDSSGHHDSFIRVAQMSCSVIGYRENPIRGPDNKRDIMPRFYFASVRLTYLVCPS